MCYDYVVINLDFMPFFAGCTPLCDVLFFCTLRLSMQPLLRNVIGMKEEQLLEKGGEGTFGILHDWPAVK